MTELLDVWSPLDPPLLDRLELPCRGLAAPTPSSLMGPEWRSREASRKSRGGHMVLTWRSRLQFRIEEG